MITKLVNITIHADTEEHANEAISAVCGSLEDGMEAGRVLHYILEEEDEEPYEPTNYWKDGKVEETI